MATRKGKGPTFDSGLCRCCGNTKKCRVLNLEYESLGQKEVYSDMIMDCFSLVLSHLDGLPSERLICATCVSRIRDALSFRSQVLRCEEAFLKMKINDNNGDDTLKLESKWDSKITTVTIIKVEPDTIGQQTQSSDDDDDDNCADALADTPDGNLNLEIEEDPDDLPLTHHASERKEDTVDTDSNLTINSPAMESLQEESLPPPMSVSPSLAPPMSVSPSLPPPMSVSPSLPSPPRVATPKLSMSKVQQLMRERDITYMTEMNILTIIEYSFVCPFKCRHNHLLCYYCGDLHSDPALLRHHTVEHHHPKKFKVTEHKKMVKVDLTRIDCRLCGTKINDLDEFKRHISNVHNRKYYFNYKDSILPFRLTRNELKCAICDVLFPYFHALNKHMNEHFSNYVCETCGLGFVDKGRFMMHQQRHEQGDFPCPDCGKVFKAQYNRDLHVDRVHRKKGRVYCPKCDVKLMSYSQKLKHLVERFPGLPRHKEGEFPCSECGKVFKAQYNRDLHVDRVHRKKGRVYCPKCDVKLMSYSQKLKHLVEVHGEEPLSFPCTMCERIFDTRRMLTIHRRKDHLKDFRYDCQCCGQKFFTRFALNNHMPTHTGERNFKCKVCEKSYPRLKTLKDHMRIHTNDRRYRCHVCGQAFIQNCSLKGHMKSQHPEYELRM